MKSEVILNSGNRIHDGSEPTYRLPATDSPTKSGFSSWARDVWRRIVTISRRSPAQLRLCESLPLGDRRFVAVVEFEQSRFLVGGTSASLVLLAQLQDSPGKSSVASANEILTIDKLSIDKFVIGKKVQP